MHAMPIATTRSATGIPTGRLAMWLLLSSEIFIFGGLIAAYLLYRMHHSAAWAEDAALTNTVAGAINTFVLLTSSLIVVLAHAAAEKKQTDRAFNFLWLTILGGVIFLCVKAYEYTHEIEAGLVLTKNVFWSFYYISTSLHACHVVAGMLAMVIVSFDVKKGKNLQRVEYCGISLHFVDIVWIFLFPLLYIAK